MASYSIVTVTFPDELGFLRLQARSLATYLPRSLITEIIVIVNEPPPMPSNWQDRVLRAYGDLAPRVRVLTAHDLSDVRTQSGWFSQQLLKLLAARTVTTDGYLILDSKNHLVFPFSKDYLEVDGKPRMFMHDYHSHPLKHHLHNALEYFGLPADDGPFVTTTTPFIMPTAICREMIEYVEHKEQRRFADVFLGKRLTEFFMLGAYIQKTRGFAEVYAANGMTAPVIWRDLAPDTRAVQGTIAGCEWSRMPFFAVHRKALPLLKPDGRRAIAEFWLRRGLFPSGAHALAHLRYPNI